MNDHEDLFLRVRAVLAEAGFEEISSGAGGVHLIHHARGIMVGWMPTELTHPSARGRGARRPGPVQPDLHGLRRAFGLALAAALRGAGVTVKTRGEEWLLVACRAVLGCSRELLTSGLTRP
ncbi:hypothetical protein ACFYYB_33635 [Streptomyces sp. NPDC002886]|uniref:hypothetical protein n=1 Tax=Streptomyces sp. NPDC002886 TaxID=3364667 RepID=UPI0036A0A21B